ncbi:NAD-dependent epimerase/dehydratase family protein [Glaciecola siphonariae]|uniref:NAD-dependent epimerase/dehydratase family protein n=1 Tax=Glaciecola siphonariae TaxID=521012 RepID=A0ABV9M0D9_9ALTE
MKTCIIGLGWLGVPLAKHMQQLGHTTNGTTRSTQKIAALANENITAHEFDLFAAPPQAQLAEGLFNDANVIINIAPGRRDIDASIFTEAMHTLVDYVFACGAKHLVFVSTTSVFGNQQGCLNEDDTPNAVTPSGIAHQSIERYIVSNYASKATILRLAGLIGLNPDGSLRHPVSALARKSNIRNGHHPVNLLHQHDAIAFISAIISVRPERKILHACSLLHPSRREYYTWAGKKLGLGTIDFTPPEDDKSKEVGKTIDASASLKALNLRLYYPSPFDMLDV